MSSAGSLWVEILPKFVGGAAAIRDEVVPQATAAGTQAGAEISKGIADGAKAGAAEASATIRASIVESAQISGAEANAILAKNMTGNLAKQLASELKAAEAAVTDSALKMQAANAKAEASANQVGVAEAKLAEARSKYAADSSQVVAAEARLADAETKSALSADAATAATKTHTTAQASYVTARNDVAKAEEAGTLKTAEAEAASTKLSNTVNSLVPGVGKLSSGYAKLGAVIGAAIVIDMGVHAVSAAADFQSSQERLVTTAGEVQSNLKLVSDGILQMSGAVGISAQDLSVGMYKVESAGFHGADALNVMKAAAQGAKEENADLATVTDAVTSAMQDYHLGAGDAALVTSKLITAVSDGKTTFQDLTGSLHSVLPVASQVGISMSEILGDLSSMTLHGVSADQASQNLANAIRSLANPTLAATKELAALGLNAADLSKNLGKTGVQGTMEEVSTAILQKMGPAGTTLLNAFNQSKQAAADAATMFSNLPPKLQDLAKGFQNGSISLKDWRTDLKALPADQVAMLTQWQTMTNSANGFSDALKTGGNASQTYTQALAKATGNSTSMNVALMLTGENAEKTKQNIADVSKATTEAGNNTKGWADIQGTFNQKMSEAKSAMGALGISIGTALLPFMTKLADVFATVANWMSKHQTLTVLLIAGFGALTLAIGIATIGMWALSAATTAVAIPLTVIEAPLWIIVAVIAAVIAAIAALGYGIYELVTHWSTVWHAIAEAAQAVWEGVLKPVFGAIGTAAQAVGHAFETAFDAILSAAQAVGHAFAVAFNAVIDAAKAVGAAFVWLWNTVLEPIFNVISIAVRILAAVVYTILVTPLVLLFKYVLAPVFTWLYDTVIHPIFNAIATLCSWLVAGIKFEIQAFANVFHWLYDSAIKPVGDAIGAVFHWIHDTIIVPIVAAIQASLGQMASSFHWLYDNAIKPVGDAIGWVCNWLYNNVIKPLVANVGVEINQFAGFIHWLYDSAIKPVGDLIGNVFNWLYNNVVRPVVAGIKNEIQVWADVFNWIYNNVIKPVSGFIGDAFHGIGQAVQNVVGWISDQWNRIQDIVKTPAKFIVDIVYNNGIVPVWNGIQGVFGIGAPLGKVDVSRWAGGGILPGYAPGQDTIHAMLSPGEAVLTPEAAKLLGYGNILKLNAMSGRPSGNDTNGMPIHASGGFIGGIENIAGDIGGAISNAAGAVWNGLQTTAGWISKGVGAVTGEIGSLFGDVLNKVKGTPDQGNDFTTSLTDIPGKVIQGAIDKVKAWFSTNSSWAGGGGAIPSAQHLAIISQALAADGIPQSDWGKWAIGLNTLITRESGWNPSAVNNWDSNAAAGHPSQGLGQMIIGTFESNRNPALPDNILDPVANIASVIRYIIKDYGDITRVQQANASMPPKGYSGGGIAGLGLNGATLLDSGGWLQPGVTQVVNASGKAEPVFSSGQWKTLEANVGKGHGGDTVYNITSHDPTSVVHEMERKERAEMAAKLV